MKIGIVGNGKDKFDINGELWAKSIIRNIMIANPQSIYVSGHSPLGGVDIWVEEIANELNLQTDIKPPPIDKWDGGYKDRNLEIAEDSDVVFVVVMDEYIESYKGRRWNICYHCKKNNEKHIKSGACWTAIKALNMGKDAFWFIYPSMDVITIDL